MHPGAIEAMESALHRAVLRGGRCLDVGSLDVNGSYRMLVMAQGWRYTGLDTRPGRNVDIVTDDPYRYPFDDNTFEAVISGSTMEHVEAIWQWIPELVRVLKPGGLLAILTHWQFPVHRYPVDCWRILPDGMELLFDMTGRLDDYDIRIVNDTDIIASAYKR